MTRRRRSGSSSPSDTFSRLHAIGGADMALRYLQMLDEARARDASPVDPQPAPAPAPVAAPPASGAAKDIADLFGVLRSEFERDKQAMEPDRRAGLEDFMGRLGGLVERGSASVAPGRRGLAELDSRRSELDGLLGEFLARAGNPTLRGPGATPGTRGARLMARLEALKLFVGQSGMQRAAGSGANATAMDLFARIARLTTRLSEAGDNAEAVLRIERDEARGLAAEVVAFAQRRNLMLARPVWGCRNMARHANSVFFSGPDASLAALAARAPAHALTMAHAAPAGADFATRRWHDLRAAGVAVFDLADLHPQVFYELGIALAIGAQLVLIAPEGALLPFDIAQTVHRYGRPAGLKQLLDEQLGAAPYELQVQPDAQSTLPATLACAEAQAARGDNPFARYALEGLRAAGDNAAQFLAALRSFNGYLGVDEHEILHTRWPGRYPDALQRRWFAVMPFRPEQDLAHAMLQRTLSKLDPLLQPVRGDLAEGQQIIRSIWDEICRAALVTVDLSDLNPNACLELGIAHTLGRSTVLVAREGTERLLQARLPGAAKWRCHTYSATDPQPSATLKTALGAALKPA